MMPRLDLELDLGKHTMTNISKLPKINNYLRYDQIPSHNYNVIFLHFHTSRLNKYKNKWGRGYLMIVPIYFVRGFVDYSLITITDSILNSTKSNINIPSYSGHIIVVP